MKTLQDYKKNGRYTDEFKEKVKQMIKDGVSVTAASKELGLEFCSSTFSQYYYQQKRKEQLGVELPTIKVDNGVVKTNTSGTIKRSAKKSDIEDESLTESTNVKSDSDKIHVSPIKLSNDSKSLRQIDVIESNSENVKSASKLQDLFVSSLIACYKAQITIYDEQIAILERAKENYNNLINDLLAKER